MKQVAYLGVYELDDGGFAGGILVCDHRGLPLDFRYVEPIRPTKLQRLIYGAALKRYLIVEAIGAGLVKECNAAYDLTIVDENLLLELEGRCKAPIFLLEKTSREPFEERGQWEKVDEGVVNFQASYSGGPVALRYSGENGSLDELMDELTALSDSFDIIEPLDRVKKAVEEVGNMNSGKSKG